jgi:hypothetical protein
LATIIAMACNWLASAELPGTFWFFAVKRAAEVCNYFPLKLECGTWTTPLQLAHNVKPDLRNLFCLFSVAAVHRGKYQPEVFIYRLDESTSIFTPKFMLESSVLMHTHSPPSMVTVIGIPTYDKLDVYTVSFCDGSISEYTEDLLSAVPPVSPSSVSSLLPKWIKGGVRATLFLQTMHQPKHGTLQVSSDHSWVFSPGKNSTNESIPLPNFEANCQQLLDTAQLFQGHTKFRNFYTARSLVSL